MRRHLWKDSKCVRHVSFLTDSTAMHGNGIMEIVTLGYMVKENSEMHSYRSSQMAKRPEMLPENLSMPSSKF